MLVTLFQNSNITYDNEFCIIFFFSWCGHPRIADSVKPPNSPPVLSIPRQMIKLPESFSDLVKRASSFKCPKRLMEGEDSQAAMLCLVCGDMLCTNSYCCQVIVSGSNGDEDSESQEEKRIGGFVNHAQRCVTLCVWGGWGW